MLDYVEHAWVARVSCWHFVFACVDVADWAQKVTVANSSNYDPASLVTGARRYSFNLDGALALFARLYARNSGLQGGYDIHTHRFVIDARDALGRHRCRMD